MIDVNKPHWVEIKIRDDYKVVWINTEEGCQCRINNPGAVMIVDPDGQAMLDRIKELENEVNSPRNSMVKK